MVMVDIADLKRTLRRLGKPTLDRGWSWVRHLQPLVAGLDRALQRLRESDSSAGIQLWRLRLPAGLEGALQRLRETDRAAGIQLPHQRLQLLAERVRPSVVREEDTPDPREQPRLIHRIAAAYKDHDLTLLVVTDLVRAGFHPNAITVTRPNTTCPTGSPRWKLPYEFLHRPLKHPYARKLAKLMAKPSWFPVFGALLMGFLMSVVGAGWFAPHNWPAFTALGVLAGVMSGVVASAIGALETPRLAPDYLGAAYGQATVEVEVGDEVAARVATKIIVRYRPARLQTTAWLAPDPPMWRRVAPRTPVQPAPDRSPARRAVPTRPWPQRARVLRRT